MTETLLDTVPATPRKAAYKRDTETAEAMELATIRAMTIALVTATDDAIVLTTPRVSVLARVTTNECAMDAAIVRPNPASLAIVVVCVAVVLIGLLSAVARLIVAVIESDSTSPRAFVTARTNANELVALIASARG